ncbi:MAG: hypothetical protein F7B20_03165 [Aeropyrum sp.]|nr:hypothetical protein [Aeropyrum sp.]
MRAIAARRRWRLVGGALFVPEPGVPIGFHGAVEWSRISRLPLPRAAEASIGRVLTSAEALRALERRMALDPRAPRLEGWRRLGDVRAWDRAGLVRTPRPGLYWKVFQLDFHSLYPTIIARHNLSGETVGARGCRSEVPEGGAHPVCTDVRGVVAEVLGGLVSRRAAIKKALSAAIDTQSGVLRERSEALKWILVSGFGYLGFRNSLFGSILAYENVTAIARRTLLKAERAARRAGFRIVHSIVDSIFVQPAGSEAPSPGELARLIERETGIGVKVEAVYRWLYIPRTLGGVGAGNKYYGLLEDGGVKVKGVMAVRRDTPRIVARAQRRAIMELAKAERPESFGEALMEAHRVLDKASSLLMEGRVGPEDLVIVRRSSIREARLYRSSYSSRLAAYVATVRDLLPVEAGPPRPREIDWEYYAGLIERARREIPGRPEAP